MKTFFKWLFILFIFIITLIIYARFIGTMGLITKEYTIIDESLPIDFDGLKIVHFSDLHYNRAITIEKVNKIIQEINRIHPDIVVFTGDLIDKDASLSNKDYRQLTSSLSKINSKYGCYSIMGNHDYHQDIDKIKQLYQNSNFTYLDNSHDIIYSTNNQKIFIGGLNSVTFNKHDIPKMMQIDNINDYPYKIILIHEPDITDKIVDNYQVNLILAGHSHNGQIKIPGIGAIYKPPYAKKYYDEHYHIKKTDLYISSGIGVSTINYRLFNHPSINFYRINKTSN